MFSTKHSTEAQSQRHYRENTYESQQAVATSVDANDTDVVSSEVASPVQHVAKTGRRNSLLDEDEEQSILTAVEAETATKPQDEPVTWLSLPNKGQLAVLTIARLSEPLSERSLAAYMFFQLKWFDPSASESTITAQGGLLTSAFAAAQFLTAVWWGRAADTPWIGRKKVLLVGLTGTAIASIGVGFSKTFYQAMFFRALAGALNGNIGVMRTMLSEIIKEKRFQSRAFLLLPMCFNIGVVIGPMLGGFLADPIQSFPNVFGPGGSLGGKDGVSWMTSFPYALPNLFSGIFILISAMSVVFGLDETHEALRHRPDRGRQFGKFVLKSIMRYRDRSGYTQVATDEAISETELQATPARPTPRRRGSQVVFPRSVPDVESRPPSPANTASKLPSTPLSLRRILTKNVLLTLAQHHLLAFHVSSFNALIFLLLPAPWNANKDWHFPSARFTGGLGLSQERVGLAMAILGVIGLPLQLILYPPLNARLGTLPGYRTFLPFSILAYLVLPFLVLLPQSPAWHVWALLSLVLAAQVLSRTFALTGTVILVNNSSPSRASLGTIHGIAQSASSAARMIGPMAGGAILGLGLSHNFVAGIWWFMAIIAAANWSLLFLIYEGDGSGGKA